MNISSRSKLVIALVLLAAAACLFVKLYPTPENQDGKSYFYDLKEHKLFVAPRSSIPPIPGLQKGELSGVRAIVVSTNGNSADKTRRKIAYLEKYAFDLKEVLEAVQAGKGVEGPSRRGRQGLTLVKRLSDSQWYPVGLPAAGKMM